MVRVYKNNTAYIVCEVKIFKNGISYGTTNNMINEFYIKQIIKDPDNNNTIVVLGDNLSIIVNENYDDFIIEFFRPDPVKKTKQNRFLTY